VAASELATTKAVGQSSSANYSPNNSPMQNPVNFVRSHWRLIGDARKEESSLPLHELHEQRLATAVSPAAPTGARTR
jgi:hypothetical protein